MHVMHDSRLEHWLTLAARCKSHVKIQFTYDKSCIKNTLILANDKGVGIPVNNYVRIPICSSKRCSR